MTMIILKYEPNGMNSSLPIKNNTANGVRVITVPMKNTSAVTSIVFVKTGSRHEYRKENGISHVLEHMLFQGTKNARIRSR